MEQIKGVFAGGIADWGALPAARAEADAASRPTAGKVASGSTKLTASKINCYALKDAEPAAGLFARECLPSAKFGRVTLKKDSNDVIAAVGMDPQAIGFVDLTACSNRPLGVNSGAEGAENPYGGTANVKVLAIQVGMGEKAKIMRPTEENIRNAMYPLSQRLYLYVHPKASDVAKDFAKFLATCGGSEATPYADTVKSVMDAYQKHGLIPLADAAIERRAKDAAAAARAAAAKAEKEKAAGGKATKKPAR
jgi:ABC-type phosphate transport system substrate-binding protein